jgi:hypothetical protein
VLCTICVPSSGSAASRPSWWPRTPDSGRVRPCTGAVPCTRGQVWGEASWLQRKKTYTGVFTWNTNCVQNWIGWHEFCRTALILSDDKNWSSIVRQILLFRVNCPYLYFFARAGDWTCARFIKKCGPKFAKPKQSWLALGTNVVNGRKTVVLDSKHSYCLTKSAQKLVFKLFYQCSKKRKNRRN